MGKTTPKIVQEIKKGFPKGIFTVKDFNRQLRFGDTFYQVGFCMGHGPMEPQEFFITKLDRSGQDFESWVAKTFQTNHKEDMVYYIKGIFLTMQEAWDYYNQVAEAFETDEECKNNLITERKGLADIQRLEVESEERFYETVHSGDNSFLS
ncbi:MAG: hypothetical protein JWM20_96 [Patescibacteria group bacterium]|nr:hypothetical protein [Patescibacteria group bacterium]